MERRSMLQWLAAFTLLAALGSGTKVEAAPPPLRAQVNQRGDFVLTGNTLAHDCAPGTPIPVVGTVGSCGMNVDDGSPDVYWMSDIPVADNAAASTAISPEEARSTALLTIPDGALVTHAFLYWGAKRGTAGFDDEVTLERPDVFGGKVQSLTGFEAASGMSPSDHYYQSVADVTSIVQTYGAGAYRVSGVDAVVLEDQYDDQAFAGWWMVIFYELATDPLRNLTLFDGLGLVTTGITHEVTVDGFVAANAGIDAKLSVVAYAGNDTVMGDQLFVNDSIPLSDAFNPQNNFFNGTRTLPGSDLSLVGDLPRTSGQPRSLSGIDLDTIDIAPKLLSGATSFTIKAASTNDVFFLAGIVTSIVTVKDQCSSDADCAAPKPGCDTTATPHVCVECMSSAHCPGEAPTCDSASQTCICVPMGNETCNAADDNCDGSIDEGDFGQDAVCSTELLGACVEGVTKCTASGLICIPFVAPGSQVEVCDNSVDEDCDGALDNGCGAGGAGTSSGEELIYYNGCVCEVRPGTVARDLAWTLLVGAGIFAARRRRGQHRGGASTR